MGIKLLRHPLPYEYESLANYILRLSESNCCQISWLNESFKVRIGPNSLDKYNISISPNSINKISDATKLSYNDICNMTINRFNIWKYDCINYREKKDLQKFFSLDHYYFCPQCLKETNYDKLYWKLKLIKVCMLHQLQLISQCTNCGKNITYKDIIARECTCGTRLQDMISTKVRNTLILKNQSRIYSLFSILDISNEYKIFNFNNTDIVDYANFIHFLNGISFEYINLLSKNKFFEYDCNYSLELNNLISVEKILEAWPTNFFELMDLINEYKSHMAFNIADLTRGYFNQFIHLNYYKSEALKISDINFIRKYLRDYLYTRYTFEAFSKLLNPILVDDRFIKYDYAISIFGISYAFIQQNFDIFHKETDTNSLYLDLKQIVDFFNQFIKNNDLDINEQDISVNMLVDLFYSFDLSLFDIMKLILINKLEIKIDPLKNGTHMIYVPKIEAQIAILEFILNKLKNSNT